MYFQRGWLSSWPLVLGRAVVLRSMHSCKGSCCKIYLCAAPGDISAHLAFAEKLQRSMVSTRPLDLTVCATDRPVVVIHLPADVRYLQVRFDGPVAADELSESAFMMREIARGSCDAHDLDLSRSAADALEQPGVVALQRQGDEAVEGDIMDCNLACSPWKDLPRS